MSRPVDLRLLCEEDGFSAFIKLSHERNLAGAIEALFPEQVFDRFVVNHSSLVKYLVLAEFEDGCVGFPCYGKANGVISQGMKFVLYGEYQRSGKGNSISGIFIRCQEATKLEFMADRSRQDTCFDLTFKFNSSFVQPTQSQLEPKKTTAQCVCLLGCEFSTVQLSDLVYRICGLHGSDEALAHAIAPELSIFKSLISPLYRKLNKSVDVDQESSYHAIVKSKHKKIVKVHCGSQHEIIKLSASEHCAERTVNGVTREAVEKKYTAAVYLAPPQASRLFHIDCWKDQKRRALKTKFTTSYGAEPKIVECLACSKVGCKPNSVLTPPAAVTVIYDIPLYKQALPMLLLLQRSNDVSSTSCLLPDAVSDDDDSGLSAKRARTDDESDSDEDSGTDEEVIIQHNAASPLYRP